MALKNTDVLPHDAIKPGSTAEYTRQQYIVIIPKQHKWPLPCTPDYWRHHKLNQYDRLELLAEDGSFDVDARVCQAGQGWAIIRILREWHAAAEVAQGESGEAHVAFIPNSGWTLFDAAGSPIARFADEDSANTSLQEHLAAQPKEAAAA